MNKDTLNQLKALVVAGDKATQGEWVSFSGHTSHDAEPRECLTREGFQDPFGDSTDWPITTEKHMKKNGWVGSPDKSKYRVCTAYETYDQDFITLAANSREAIKSAIAEIEAKDKEIESLKKAVERWQNNSIKALGACEATERSEDNDE